MRTHKSNDKVPSASNDKSKIGNFKINDVLNTLEAIKNLYIEMNDNLEILVSPSLGQSLQKFVNLVFFTPQIKGNLNSLNEQQRLSREILSYSINIPPIMIIEEGQELTKDQKTKAQEEGIIFLIRTQEEGDNRLAHYEKVIFSTPNTNGLKEKPLSMRARARLHEIFCLNNPKPGEIIINQIVAGTILRDIKMAYTPTRFTSDIFENYIHSLIAQDDLWIRGADVSKGRHPNCDFHEYLFRCLESLFLFVMYLPEDPKLMIDNKALFLLYLEDFLAFSSLRTLICSTHRQIYNTLSFTLQQKYLYILIPINQTIEHILETINNKFLPSYSNANSGILDYLEKLRGILTNLMKLSAESTQTQDSELLPVSLDLPFTFFGETATTGRVPHQSESDSSTLDPQPAALPESGAGTGRTRSYS